MESARCPQCHAAMVVAGTLIAKGKGVVSLCFVPSQTRWFRWRQGVDLRTGFHSCVSCGHLWTTVAPDELRLFIETYGTELARQHLALLEAGPGQDVPNIPEALDAARKAEEMDALILDGKTSEATRRYYQLAATTWDDAINAVRVWSHLKRAEKLARFGWSPTEVPGKDDLKEADHPMRDRSVDG